MHNVLCLIVHTANLLGLATDPFEFDGNYGPEVDPLRKKVFELVVPKEALARDLPDHQIQLAIVEDAQHGPMLSELVGPEILEALQAKQRELNNPAFSEAHLQSFIDFIDRYKDQKIFRFLHYSPPPLLNLEKRMIDHSIKQGKTLALPCITSIEPLKGRNALELKLDLLNALFTDENLSLPKPEADLIHALRKGDESALKQVLGEEAVMEELTIFCSPSGQVFFYWLYQAMNLHLIAGHPGLIEDVNQVKAFFAQTFGNPEKKAGAFREKITEAGTCVLFTQESDGSIKKELTGSGQFLSVDQQNPEGGCYVFLKSDVWNPDYACIALDEPHRSKHKRINLILAQLQQSGERFLLASCHGDSTNALDGREKVRLVLEKHRELSDQYPGLQLVIGIDANTKSEEDVDALRALVEECGAIATQVGPTTIKKRMVTVQHSKAGREAKDEEDFLITLKVENGGHYLLTNPTVGFTEKPYPSRTLPDSANLSDHYPVGVTLLGS
jgi:hypothetical protein